MAQNNQFGRTTEEIIRENLNKLTTNITYIVLIGFVLILVILLIKSITSYKVVNGQNEGEAWLDLFRDSFLILSGILTTLIGYYFGSRGSDIALKQAEKIKKESEKILTDVQSLAPTDETQDSGIEAITIN